jgi:hypothetical protein
MDATDGAVDGGLVLPLIGRNQVCRIAELASLPSREPASTVGRK